MPLPWLFQMTILHYLFIITSLALFTMCIKLTQLKLDLLKRDVIKTIANEYKETLKAGGMQTNPKQVQQMIREQGGKMRYYYDLTNPVIIASP